MGNRILSLAEEDPDFEVAAALERADHPDLGKEYPGGARLTGDCEEAVRAGDVVISFATPQAAVDHAEAAARASKGYVSGTTGLNAEQMSALRESAHRIPTVWAPNMAVGANLLYRLSALAAATLGENFDVEITEAHHRFKKDAPSGTALKAGQVIAEVLGWDLSKVANFGREGIIGERPRAQIGFHAVRGGDIVAELSILFVGMGERLEIRHQAHSRDCFSRGALLAAKFVHGKGAGIYTFEEVLGFEPPEGG